MVVSKKEVWMVDFFFIVFDLLFRLIEYFTEKSDTLQFVA